MSTVTINDMVTQSTDVENASKSGPEIDTSVCAHCGSHPPLTQYLIAKAAQDDRVDDLSMLARRLVHALSKAAPDHTLPAKAMDYLQRKGLQGSPLRDEAVKRDDVAGDASAVECIELAQALEQARAIKIAETVAALQIGGATSDMPTPFQSGFQLACEEITHRLRTEEWDLCLTPIDAVIQQDDVAGDDEWSRAEQIRSLSSELTDRDATIARLMDDAADRCQGIYSKFTNRLAIMLECMLIDPNGSWNESANLLDEYKAAWDAINPQHPTFMGEPMPPDRKLRLMLELERRAASKEAQ